MTADLVSFSFVHSKVIFNLVVKFSREVISKVLRNKKLQKGKVFL